MIGVQRMLLYCIFGACFLTFGCVSETPTSTPTLRRDERPTAFTLSLTRADLITKMVGFRMDLDRIEKDIDKVTPQTPPDKWKSIVNKFAELRTTHRSLNGRFAHYEKDKRKANINKDDDYLQELLKHNERRIEELSVRMQRTGERYAVDRRKWEEQKAKYEEHLVKCLREAGVAEGLIYTDSKLVVCINSVVVMSESVSVIVGTYLREPPTGNSTSSFLMWMEHMRGTLGFAGLTDDYLRSRIFAYSMDGASMGFPTRTKVNRLSMINGFVTALTYEGKVKAENDSLKVVIEQAAFNSETEIQFQIPSDEIIFITNTASTDDHVSASPIDDAANRLPKRLKVIQCQREGMHLRVPTELNIHGKKIKTDMLLDTGASVTVISKELYSKGQTVPTEKLQKQRIQTANGLVDCFIDILGISTIAYSRKVEVAIVDDCLPLLGANYFAGHVFTVDLDNQCVYVHP